MRVTLFWAGEEGATDGVVVVLPLLYVRGELEPRSQSGRFERKRLHDAASALLLRGYLIIFGLGFRQ